MKSLLNDISLLIADMVSKKKLQMSLEISEDLPAIEADELKVKAAELIHPTRVAISGKTVGAGLFDMMELLGREKVLKRLAKFC